MEHQVIGNRSPHDNVQEEPCIIRNIAYKVEKLCIYIYVYAKDDYMYIWESAISPCASATVTMIYKR